MASDMAVGGGLTFRQADDVTSGRQCDIVVSAQEAPGLQRLPDDALATMRSTKNKQKPTPWDFHDVGLSADLMVGATGLEPAISCSQSRRASHYATPRWSPSDLVAV